MTEQATRAIIRGKMMTDVSIAIVQSVITIVVAIGMGAAFITGFPGVLLILATVAFFELALSGIFLTIGMRSRRTGTISAIGGVLFFPLIFVSSAMFLTAFFLAWAQTTSRYNPVSYALDVARGLVQGGSTSGTLASAYLVIGFITLVTIAATLYQFRKVIC